MVQFRRLDPLANAGPWQRAMKRGVKTFTLTQAQYDAVAERRPQLIVTGDDSVVMGRPYRDFLQVHYAYAEVPAFRDHFKPMLKDVLAHSSRDEAPRGVLLSFRDRPNRPMANQLFWETALEESKHWVEVEYTSIPELDAPSGELEGGYSVREATAADRDAVATVEAQASGRPRLSEAGLDSLFESARWVHLVQDGAGQPVAVTASRREDAGWAVIDELFLVPDVAESLREPLSRWALAFLRSQGGRRQRRRVNLEDDADLQMMRRLGYSPAESGVDYLRPVEDADIQEKVDERKAHGTIIKFGNWR
jgi:hypothetical protein